MPYLDETIIPELKNAVNAAGMTDEERTKLDNLENIQTTGEGLNVTAEGELTLLGHLMSDDEKNKLDSQASIKSVGSGLTLSAETGELSADSYTLPTASATVLGGVKVGENLTIAEDGTLSASAGSSVGVEDSLGFSETTAISQNAATKLLYPSFGSTDATKYNGMVTAGNTLGTPADDTALGLIIGAGNTNSKGVYSKLTVLGTANTISPIYGTSTQSVVVGSNNNTNGYAETIVGMNNVVDTISKNTATAGIIIGSGNKWTAQNVSGNSRSSLIIGNNNTVSWMGSIVIGTLNSAKDDKAPNVIVGSQLKHIYPATLPTDIILPAVSNLRSTFVGNNIAVSGAGLTVIGGSGATVDYNAPSALYMTNVIGNLSVATRNFEHAIGGKFYKDGWQDFTRVLSGVTAGTLDTDAVNVKQMKDYVAANAGGSDEGTVLYTGSASVNSITLSQAVSNFDYIEVHGESTQTVNSGTINVSKVERVAIENSNNGFKMEDTTISTGSNPSIVVATDLWSISTDGTEIDLAQALVATTTNSVNIAQETTSHYTITKVVGFGKKS